MKNRKITTKLSTPWDSDYWMSSNGFYCGFNTPKAKQNENDKSLPEYAWRKAFLKDEYPSCPKNWMNSEGTMASYFVGVPKNNGMWLDFNKNQNHTHDVAIVVSIQGINPITGLPCQDPNLEQYHDSCPKCNKKFGANRHCEGCGFRWPKQNYIATTAQPNGQLWIDGFRTADGLVRQYIFTDDVVKGVASNIIGKDRVFAVGISYFISKNKKKEKAPSITRSIGVAGNLQWFSPTHLPINWTIPDPSSYCSTKGGGTTTSSPSSSSSTPQRLLGTQNTSGYASILRCSSAETHDNSDSVSDEISGEIQKLAQTNHDPDSLIMCSHTFDMQDLSQSLEVQTSKIEVGAGTSIDQQIYDDPEDLDYWREIPEAMIVVNYALEDEVLKIIENGRKELVTKENGFLHGIPVGK